MTLAQRFAQIFGLVYLLVGILGFIPVPPILDSPGTIQGLLAPFEPFNGFLLGIFAINWLHNVVHIAIGAAGLASYRSAAGARSYCIGIGVLYLLLFVVGLIFPLAFGLVPLFGVGDLGLHLISGAVALAIGLASPTTERGTAAGRA